MEDLGALAAGERRDLADFLETLAEGEWEAPSLCEGWSVRDVAAHVMSYDMLSWPQLVGLMARSRFSLARANEAGIAQGRRLATEELVARLRRQAEPRGITRMFGCAVALTDAVIHHQDIRRALGRPRDVPPERLVAALDFAPRARALPAPTNRRGLRLVATDVDWSGGEGAEVSGPAEALLVALAGRREALQELSGPGLAILSERVAPPAP